MRRWVTSRASHSSSAYLKVWMLSDMADGRLKSLTSFYMHQAQRLV